VPDAVLKHCHNIHGEEQALNGGGSFFAQRFGLAYAARCKPENENAIQNENLNNERRIASRKKSDKLFPRGSLD